MFKPICAWAALLSIAVTGETRANSLGIEEFMGFNDLSYSGYATYQAWDMRIEGPINRAPGELRFEFDQQGVDFIGLVQRGDDDLILVLPDHGQYTRLDGASSDAITFVPRPSAYQSATITPEGWDQWDGQTAIRSRIEGVDEQGRLLDGQLWNAPNGILLRAVLNIGERERAVVYELTDYTEGPQRFSTFLVPEGFTDMNAAVEDEPEPEVVESPPNPPQGTGSGSGGTTPAELQEAQGLLNGLGYDAGPADGVYGPRTRSAISSFQRGHDLVDTGELNRATLVVLRHVARTPAPAASGGGSSGAESSSSSNQVPGESSSRTLTEEDIQAIERMLRLSGMNENKIRRRIQQIRNSQQ